MKTSSSKEGGFEAAPASVARDRLRCAYEGSLLSFDRLRAALRSPDDHAFERSRGRAFLACTLARRGDARLRRSWS